MVYQHSNVDRKYMEKAYEVKFVYSANYGHQQLFYVPLVFTIPDILFDLACYIFWLPGLVLVYVGSFIV